MASLSDNLIANFANKFFLNEDVIKKAHEILRLIKLKSATNKSINSLNDNTQVILSLDIASLELGYNFDKEFALQLSGLKKRLYNTYYQLFKKILGLESYLTIQNVCIQNNCTSVQNECDKLFEKYKKSDKLGTKDFDHPQYACMCVYIICRIYNVKVSKSKLMEMCNLKKSQWLTLESDFGKFIEGIGLQAHKSKTDTKTKAENEQILKEEVDSKEKEAAQEEIQESYETWKARMLKYAKES